MLRKFLLVGIFVTVVPGTIMQVALGTIVFYGLVQAPERPPLDELRLADPSGLGLMFGVSLLMFSCHLEAVTIEQDMARRGAFDRMLVWSFVVLAALFLGFGACVYLSFGEATGRVRAAGGGWAEATVMQNLPEGGFLTAVKLLMSLNLLLMTPITMLPASRAIEASRRLQSGSNRVAIRQQSGSNQVASR